MSEVILRLIFTLLVRQRPLVALVIITAAKEEVTCVKSNKVCIRRKTGWSKVKINLNLLTEERYVAYTA